jgi:thiamine-monophosphate kinase
MLDSSDGLARSLHQLAAASDCGFDVAWDRLPVDPSVDAVTDDDAERRDLSTYFGEDFELVFTGPATAVDEVRGAIEASVTRIGTVTADGVRIDGAPLPDRGYSH